MKPLPVEFDPSRPVPKELFVRRNWIGWRARQRPGKTKIDKVPVSIRTGSSEGYLLPAQHVGFEEAVEGARRLKLSGLGFAMTPGCGLIGGDLDRCRDPTTGAVEPWALEILEWRETYCEISPSGMGIRFWAKGDLLHTIKYDPAGVELYASGRFLTYTGLKVDGAPQEVRDAPRTLLALMERVKAAKAAAGAPEAPEAEPEEGSAEAFKRYVYAQTPLGRINQAAMERLADWVPTLFPTAEPYHDGFTVSSEDLGRHHREERISFVSLGIKDFGEHDEGDARAGKRTPIDIVILWHPLISGDLHDPETIRKAAEWLAAELGIPFDLTRGAAADEEEEEAPGPAVVDPDADLWAQFYAALEELRAENLRPQFVTGGAIDVGYNRLRFDAAYDGPVPIRAAVTDRLTRGLVAMVAADGNTGKSTLFSLEALAAATENGALLGQATIDWCGHTLIVSNEENTTSVVARLRGQMLLLDVKATDLKHYIDVWPTDNGPLRLATLSPKGVTPTKAVVEFVRALTAMARAGEPVALVTLDPLISLTEGTGENTDQMDKVIGIMRSIAMAGFIAIDVAHHQTKNGPKEEKGSYRGSTTIFDALGEMSTLATLTIEEGRKYGLEPNQAKRTLRLTGQRQRDGAVPSVFYFERELISLIAQDPRDPTVAKLRTVATLRAIPAPSTPAGSDYVELQRALWPSQKAGKQIRRGGAKGKRHDDQAWAIMLDAYSWERARSEAAIVKLLAVGGAEVKDVTDPRGNKILYLVVAEPKTEEEDAF